MAKILEVIPGADYFVTVRFDNNHMVVLDMKKKLDTLRFSELRDKTLFTVATTDGRFINWPCGISISVSEIMEILTK